MGWDEMPRELDSTGLPAGQHPRYLTDVHRLRELGVESRPQAALAAFVPVIGTDGDEVKPGRAQVLAQGRGDSVPIQPRQAEVAQDEVGQPRRRDPHALRSRAGSADLVAEQFQQLLHRCGRVGVVFDKEDTWPDTGRRCGLVTSGGLGNGLVTHGSAFWDDGLLPKVVQRVYRPAG